MEVKSRPLDDGDEAAAEELRNFEEKEAASLAKVQSGSRFSAIRQEIDKLEKERQEFLTQSEALVSFVGYGGAYWGAARGPPSFFSAQAGGGPVWARPADLQQPGRGVWCPPGGICLRRSLAGGATPHG